MNSYKIYLTKSEEAAYLISRGLPFCDPCSKNGGELLSVVHGIAEDNDLIPACYYGHGYYYALAEYRNGYYYALAEYRNGPDDSCPEYSLVIC